MKIKIEQFGPIQSFSYDLEKNLIAVYGDNNIGKSYSMQIVYLFLKAFRVPAKGEFDEKMTIIYTVQNSIKSRLSMILQNDAYNSRTLSDLATNVFYDALESLCLREYIRLCQNTFGYFDNVLRNDPKIIVEFGSFSFRIDLRSKCISRTIDIAPEVPWELKREADGFFWTLLQNDDLKNELTMDLTARVLSYYDVYIDYFERNFSNIYFLPASRSGIYTGMSAFSSIVAEMSKNRSRHSNKIDLPGLTEPIADYFITL
ncbi:MAG: ATP-binding protein, partial [Lachnospiraceae bacterium]|nr:ATP-binding protein [Lachnospiraceae bacterium]